LALNNYFLTIIINLKLLSMKRLVLFLTLLLFAAVQLLQAQAVQISGKVTSAEDGSPMPGASIVVKGTTVGTLTDAEGNYSLLLPAGATELVVSFVGMKSQDIRIEGRTEIDVVLEVDILGQFEVVVTAMGITREKKALGYSVQDVSSEELSRAGNPNMLTSLSGKIAGVEIRQQSGMPGAPSTMFIRGARSFSGNNQPLYVVDGMPISSGSDWGQNVTEPYYSARSLDIDPNNIESINVLKGQVAAALYGIRASNGVIVITTKGGKSVSAGRPTVGLTSSYTVDVNSRFPDVQQTWAQGYYEDFYAPYSFSWGPKITNLPDIPTYGGNSQGHPGQWFDPYKGQWVAPKAYNNPKGYFQNGGLLYNGINISNSAGFGSYYVGFSSTNQNGIIPNTGMNRYTANANATVNLGKKWTAGFSGNYSDLSLKKIPSGNNSWLFTVYGAPASFDLMGTPYHMEGLNGKYRQITYRRGAVGENPRWATENNQFNETTRRFFGNTYLEFNPFSWAKVKYQLGIDTYTTDNEDIYEMGSSVNGQAFPTGYLTPTNLVYQYRAPTGGSINNYGLMTTTLNSLLTATLTKNFTEDLVGTLILGNEISDDKTRTWTMNGTGFTIPGWDNMSNTTTQTADESKSLYRSVGTFGNLSVDFRNMLFFNATGRYDIVSSMPHGNRSFFYPSVSLGWIFTELGPLKGNNIMNYGKIRASYAEVGQAGTYREMTYGLGGSYSGFLNDGIVYPLGGVSGFRPNSTLYDPKLVPQNTKNWELGIELKFLNNRLGLDYTYSNQDATNQIFSVPVAASTGYASFVTNAGEMTSKAHEIVFYATPVQVGGFEWNLTANFTKVKNMCVSLAAGVESISLAGYETPNVRASAGDTYPAIYGGTILRDANGKILIDDNPESYYYGFPQFGDFGKIGDVSPDFIVGLSNTFKYKFVSLSALFDWKQGGDMYSGSNRLIGLYGAAGFTEDRVTPFSYADTENSKGTGVKSDGSVNDIVRGGPDDIYAYPDYWADIWGGGLDELQIYETSYIKLREVTLTFQLPKSVASTIRMQGASLSLVGRNFLLWTTLPNFDPETSQGQGNGIMGFEYMSMPQTTSYGLSLNLTF
jgi:TonB-linked SusC/RagA family outer membrane protein